MKIWFAAAAFCAGFFAVREHPSMGDDQTGEWLPALLTAGSFIATVCFLVVGLLDALDGSLWYRFEFALGVGSAISFTSLVHVAIMPRS